jgi:hypothetical protein
VDVEAFMTSFRSSPGSSRRRMGRALFCLALLASAAPLASTTTVEAQGHHRGPRRGHRPPPRPVRVADPFSEPGRFTAANLRLDGQSHEVVVAPGATIRAELDVLQDCPGCGGAISQIIVGFAGAPEAQACVWSGGARSGGWEHTRFTLVAPSRPGDYEVRVRYAQAYGCAQGALGWWRVDRPNGPGPEATIGVVHVAAVQPPPPAPPPPPPARGPLIRNGSFEAPALGDGQWQTFPAIPGWQLSGGSSIEVQSRAAGSPSDGRQLVELDGESSSGIFQDVRTVPGATYVLRLAFSPRPGTEPVDNQLSVRVDGREVGRAQGDGRRLRDTRWRYVTFRFVAASPVTRIELVDVGRSNGVGTYVDDVSLMPVGR